MYCLRMRRLCTVAIPFGARYTTIVDLRWCAISRLDILARARPTQIDIGLEFSPSLGMSTRVLRSRFRRSQSADRESTISVITIALRTYGCEGRFESPDQESSVKDHISATQTQVPPRILSLSLHRKLCSNGDSLTHGVHSVLQT